ncbi:MAG TPA: gliding motility-associated C-terminal domain-containing protein [Chitinophagaceae bacterium]|jgi:gliding motility-associated-like protein|nr:gliding motility-associated C-terminal domain-containing protein [Chitinophagaceae bacterium]
MNKITVFVIFVAAILLTDCSKSHNSTNHINCDKLVTDTLGTSDTAKIYMPNAFTPNADGLNDYSFPITENISTIDFIIYDENNNIVFETIQIGQGWSSAPNPNTYKKYYYKIQVTTTSNHKIGMCGELYALKCIPSSMIMSDFRFQDQFSQNGFTLPTNEMLANCP